MSRLNFILLPILLISACSFTAPYVDRRRNAGQPKESLYVGKSTPEEPAICYNKLTTSYSQIQNLATAECQNQETGVIAIPTKQTIMSCKLFTPNHFYFKCQ